MEFRIEQSLFEAVDDYGTVVGRLEFRDEGGAVALTHTYVPRDYSARRIGSALVGYALAHARDQGWKVLPYCSFIAHFIDTHPEFVQLVPEDRLAEFGLNHE